MKIKIALLDNDRGYLNRISAVFSTKYIDKIEVYTFTELDSALETVLESKIDVLVSGDSFDIDVDKLPKRCGFVYFVDSPDIDKFNGYSAICKFQKVDSIYKQILSVYSEKAPVVTGVNNIEGSHCKVISFVSPAGGVGTSVSAVACARRLAGMQRKVLYMNFETFGSADVFFEADGVGSFADIIYALKSKKVSLSLKLESLVKRDSSGVYYYSPSKFALDLIELKFEEIKEIIKQVQSSYDYVVLDLDFNLNDYTFNILNMCDSIVIVTDGSLIANNKIERALASVGILEQQKDINLHDRFGLLYNRFSSTTSKKIEIDNVPEIGGIKRYEGFSTKDLIGRIVAETGSFDKLI